MDVYIIVYVAYQDSRTKSMQEITLYSSSLSELWWEESSSVIIETNGCGYLGLDDRDSPVHVVYVRLKLLLRYYRG